MRARSICIDNGKYEYLILEVQSLSEFTKIIIESLAKYEGSTRRNWEVHRFDLGKYMVPHNFA
jgi:hypothetical protein